MTGGMEIYCTGKSMNPVLRTGDIVTIIPYDGREICAGDVIVYRLPENNFNIIHRVISSDLHGVRTCGDNNKFPDSYILKAEDIIGRAIYAIRNDKHFYIYGGTFGMLSITVTRAINKIKSIFSCLLRSPYHWLAQAGIFRRWLPSCIKLQIFSFTRTDGTELQLLIGRRVIGRRQPAQTQWQIRRPFRLIIDVSSLP